MDSSDIILHDKDILFYISDFLDDKSSMSFFQMKKYHYNLFNNNRHRYTMKTSKINLGYISKEDIDIIYNEKIYNNIRSCKFVSNPFEITFITDFLLDYNNIKNYKDTYDIDIHNLDELIELYFMIYREFEKFTQDKYNIHIVFRDEYERIFDYIFDGYNNRENSSNSKNNIDIIVDVNNYHYEELEDDYNAYEDDEE